jgi:hypothetical protein
MGNTHALGQDLPRIRTLDNSLVCGPQARLRTFPIRLVLGTRGDGSCWIEVGSQKRCIQIPLDGSNATGALVKPLPEGLFHRLAAAMTKLREFGAARGNFDQGAARTCNGALQHLNEHPWSTKPHTFSKLFLPPFVGHFFQEDGGAQAHEFVHLATMQAFAVSGQFAFFGRLAPPGSQIATTRLPVKSLLASLLGAAFFIVVLRVSSPSLPIQLPKQSTKFLLVGRWRWSKGLHRHR